AQRTYKTKHGTVATMKTAKIGRKETPEPEPQPEPTPLERHIAGIKSEVEPRPEELPMPDADWINRSLVRKPPISADFQRALRAGTRRQLQLALAYIAEADRHAQEKRERIQGRIQELLVAEAQEAMQ